MKKECLCLCQSYILTLACDRCFKVHKNNSKNKSEKRESRTLESEKRMRELESRTVALYSEFTLNENRRKLNLVHRCFV